MVECYLDGKGEELALPGLDLNSFIQRPLKAEVFLLVDEKAIIIARKIIGGRRRIRYIQIKNIGQTSHTEVLYPGSLQGYLDVILERLGYNQARKNAEECQEPTDFSRFHRFFL